MSVLKYPNYGNTDTLNRETVVLAIQKGLRQMNNYLHIKNKLKNHTWIHIDLCFVYFFDQ